ncbi:MAG: hypothetical protein ABIT36_07670, partial [Steroidobacteraceae bacterium]
APEGAGRVVLDTPAAVAAQDMAELTRGADKIIVPVLPSDIDIHAASRCIANLLLIGKIRRHDNRLGVVANRVRRNTVIYRSLVRFLESLDIPIVATLRDSQNYVRAAEQGVGLMEMKAWQVQEDLQTWQPLLAWLEVKPGARMVVSPMPALNDGAQSGA